MSTSRNFGFRVPPEASSRKGRFILGGSTDRPIGAPVKIVVPQTAVTNSTDALTATLATAEQAPVQGLCGILVYEYDAAAYAGHDPVLTTYADLDVAPVGKMVQVVSGTDVKVWFKNTFARTFDHVRTYPGRLMVAGVSIATPTVKIGDLLSPGVGDDTSGYWAETSTASNAWLRVTDVQGDLVEAQMQF